MILKVFFNYYFQHVDPEVLKLYEDLLPTDGDLASAYTDMFSRNDEEAIAFLLDFYRATGELRRQNQQQAILFNVHDNVCFPFFFNHIWQIMGEEKQVAVRNKVDSSDLEEIMARFVNDIDLRNWFRHEIGSALSQQDLFTLNEIIALQNFSSGGEFSFLKYVYPHVQKMQGKVLDAGCGAGFASLVMSQYMEVYSVDACRARLERAMALSSMMNKGEKKVFPRVIKLIEDELGDLVVCCHFPSAEDLLSGSSREVVFTECSIDSLPYEENFFDMINCLDVLEHTYDPAKNIQQFGRVLKSGGRAFITVPTKYGEVEQRIYEGLEGSMFPAMLHMHHFDPVTLNQIFTNNGFKEVEIIPFDYINWESFISIADRSPAKDLADELRQNPFDEVALQLFAVYEKI